MDKKARVIGQTASVGFQIGVRRTFQVSVERAWSFLISPDGLKTWLGDVPSLSIQVGETFASREGITGEFRVVKPMQQLRLRWKRPEWQAPSTLQIRLLASGEGSTTVSFHQEKLDHPNTRELMKQLWEDVLNKMKRELTLDE